MSTCDPNKIAKMQLEDGVFHIVFERDINMTLECAKDVLRLRLEITEFIDYPLYVDIRGILSIDRNARKYLSSQEGTKNALAAAIHVTNPISKFLGNLFIKVDKPDKPTKLFTDKTNALEWLKKIK
jgi:hypothetical protein